MLWNAKYKPCGLVASKFSFLIEGSKYGAYNIWIEEGTQACL